MNSSSIKGNKAQLLGVGVQAIDLKGTIKEVENCISGPAKDYICLAPAHNLMACREDPNLRAIFNRSALTLPDGMGTVWFLRLLGHSAGRVYGPDLLQAACRAGLDAGWRHFFLGGTPQVAEALVDRLRAEHPGLQVAGVATPPFGEMSAAEERTMVAMINQAKADIVWVALGSPRQERWMAKHRGDLDAPLLIGVGAAFDFLAGAKAQAPRWLQRIGLEWLFRLLSEPRRLWRRYAQYPRFVWLALGQILGLKRYPLK
jgi:N-acetylglucosaminyldiphosphoundecaprenol N-acetyl-beta-D-mannosaminyltransferase